MFLSLHPGRFFSRSDVPRPPNSLPPSADGKESDTAPSTSPRTGNPPAVTARGRARLVSSSGFQVPVKLARRHATRDRKRAAGHVVLFQNDLGEAGGVMDIPAFCAIRIRLPMRSPRRNWIKKARKKKKKIKSHGHHCAPPRRSLRVMHYWVRKQKQGIR